MSTVLDTMGSIALTLVNRDRYRRRRTRDAIPAEPLLTPGEALVKLFLTNADRGCNADNDTLPRHGDPVGAVWSRLGELERVGNDSTLVDALRAVLLPHQPPPRYGRCPACPKRWGRRRRWPCAVWCRAHLALFSPWVGTAERSS